MRFWRESAVELVPIRHSGEAKDSNVLGRAASCFGGVERVDCTMCDGRGGDSDRLPTNSFGCLSGLLFPPSSEPSAPKGCSITGKGGGENRPETSGDVGICCALRVSEDNPPFFGKDAAETEDEVLPRRIRGSVGRPGVDVVG